MDRKRQSMLERNPAHRHRCNGSTDEEEIREAILNNRNGQRNMMSHREDRRNNNPRTNNSKSRENKLNDFHDIPTCFGVNVYNKLSIRRR